MITAVQQGSFLYPELCLLIPGIPQWWPKLLDNSKWVLGINKNKLRFKKKSQSEGGISLYAKEKETMACSYSQIENNHAFSALL